MLSDRSLRLTILFLAVAAPATGAAAPPPDSVSAITPHEKVGDPDGNTTLLRGSGSLYESIDSPAQLTAARDEGLLRTPRFFVPGDLLVLRFHSERLGATYSATNGSNSTDRFFRVLNSSATNFSIGGLNHGTEQVPSAFDLNRSNVKVLCNPTADTFSVLVDTANVSLVARDSGDPVGQTLEHREFQAILEIPTENGTRILAGSSSFEGLGVRLESPVDGVQLSGYRTPTVSADAAKNLTLTGTTPFLPGTNLTIRARSNDGSLLATRTVRTVNANASTAGFGPSAFRTTLSLTDVDRNSTVEIAIVREDAILSEQTLIIGEPAKMYNASARLVTAGPREGTVAVTATLRLPDPGFLLVSVDGEPRTVAVPEHETVVRTVYVDPEAVDETHHVYASTMWDRNENGIYEPDIDPLYQTTATVGASARDVELDTRVQVDGWPPNTTRSMSELSKTTTRETTDAPSDKPSTVPPDAESTSSSAPGLGLLIALVGIGVAVLLIARYL